MGRDKPGKTAEDPVEDGSEETLASLRAQRDELEERWQRAAADYQNLRRRGAAEADERLGRAMKPFLSKLLTVLDNLDKALSYPATQEESRTLAQGVSLTRELFVQALEQEGVSPIAPGERFDPALHEATATVRADGAPPGAILEVVRPGYTWRGEILRHTQVIVAAPEERAAGESEADG